MANRTMVLVQYKYEDRAWLDFAPVYNKTAEAALKDYEGRFLPGQLRVIHRIIEDKVILNG